MTSLTSGHIAKPAKFSQVEIEDLRVGALRHPCAAIAGVATTLTTDQSGTHFSVDASAAYAITLPAAELGLNYTFTLDAAAGQIVNVTSNAADSFVGTINQLIVDSGAAGAGAGSSVIIATAAASVNFTAASLVGDSMVVSCDRALVWNVRAVTAATSGFTLT